MRSVGKHSYAAWEVFAHRLHRLTQIFVIQEHLWISVESAGKHSYAAWKVFSHRLRGLTQILVFSRTSVNICEICGRIFIFCLKGILPQITRINTDFCYSRTSVNICEICGRTFISCLKGNLPQITQINTDFNCISCICVNLRNLWENPFYAAWEVFAHWLRRLTQILVYPRTSVNICEICGRFLFMQERYGDLRSTIRNFRIRWWNGTLYA